jgi:FkbM family methyltransferase
MPPVAFPKKISKELIRECVGREDPMILEIGCNDGSETLWFLEMFERPTVHCFEPDPRAIARFKTTVGQRPNVHLVELALSDHGGEVTFYQSSGMRSEEQAKAMPDGWDLSGSIREPKKHLEVYPWVRFGKEITVSTSTLDAWCDEHGIGTVDFIWMDVQGAEGDVLRGGRNTLAKTRFLYTEYNEDELYAGQFNLRQLMKYLEDLGFVVLIRYPEDVLFGSRAFVGTPSKALKRMLRDAHRWTSVLGFRPMSQGIVKSP